MNNFRIASTAAIYGFAAFVAFWAISILSWRKFPYPSGADQLEIMRIWLYHAFSEKIGSVLLCGMTAFFAARAYHPTWKLGVATGVLAAIMFQAFTIALYLIRFGVHTYAKANALGPTVESTVGLGALVSFIAVWRQHRRESRNVA